MDSSVNPKAQNSRVIPTRNQWQSLPVNIFLFSLVGLALFMGTCQGAQTMGWWSTSGGGGDNQQAGPTGADSSEIKGWMTIKQVIDAYKLTPDEFYKHFKIPAGTPSDTPLNQLEKIAEGFSVTTVREWLAARVKK
jgi:hypothetical protein